MRDHDRSRSGLLGTLKWLAGTSVAVALVGVCLFGWLNYTKQMARSPEVIATAGTADKESEPAKAPTTRSEAASAADKAAAERAAAEKAASEAAGAKRLEAEASQRAQARSIRVARRRILCRELRALHRQYCHPIRSMPNWQN